MPVELRRKCQVCNKNRAHRFFAEDKRRADGLSTRCTTCAKAAKTKSAHAQRVSTTYGITGADYDELLVKQGGVCAICKGKRSYRLDVDHDHKLEALGLPPRKTVRGLLCRQCNRKILRSAKDNVAVLRAAADYLEAPPAQVHLTVVT